jgi:hypothetical protein
MAGGGGGQTVTTRPDHRSQQYIDQMRHFGMQSAGALTGWNGGPAGQQGQPFMGGNGFISRHINSAASRAGFGASPYGTGGGQSPEEMGPLFLGHNGQTPEEMARPFFNPYMDQVVGGVRGEFDHLRGQALVGADQQAMQAGAFGGSRHGIMAGQRMGDLDRAQTSQIGQLQHQGWQQALGQGMQFNEYQRALQERQMQEPLFRRQMAMQMMNLGLGPSGTSSNTQGSGGNAWGSAMGGAATGSAFGWQGAAAGAGLGFLGGSLFG